MSDDQQSTPRSSIAGVDARVARLESAQAATDTKVELIQLEQSHLRELMSSRFTSVEALLHEQATSLKAFITRIDTMILQGTASSGDLEATPAGRNVSKRLHDLETEADKQQSFRDEITGMTTMLKILFGGSVLSMVVSGIALAKTLGWF